MGAKNEEIETLKEYKKKKEAEQEGLRLSGGYDEAIRPLRASSKDKSREEEEIKNSVIKD